MEKLEGWIFAYNSIMSTWGAAKREDAHDLFNNYKSNKVLRSKKFETLQELVIKTEGKREKLDKLIK